MTSNDCVDQLNLIGFKWRIQEDSDGEEGGNNEEDDRSDDDGDEC